MSRLFTSIYDFLSKRRMVTIVCLVALTAVMALLSSQISLSEDITEFLPQQEREQYETAKPQAVIRVCRSAETPCTDADIENVAGIISDIAGYEPTATDAAEYLKANIPYLLTPDDYATIDSRINADTIRMALKQTKEILISGAGEYAEQYVITDPAGMYSDVLKRVRDRGVVITLEDNPQTIERLITVTDSLKNAMPQVSVTLFSPAKVAETNAACIKKDSLIALAISAVIILVLLISFYKSIKPLVYITLSVLIGGIFSLSVIYIIKGTVSAIAVGAGSIILGIAIDYSLHYITHLKFNGSRRSTIQELASPLTIGSITTIAAFISLLFLSAEAMRDFGLFAALALIGTLIFVLVFMPQITSDVEPSSVQPHIFKHISTASIERSTPVVIIAAILTIVLGIFSTDVKFDTDMQHLTYMTAEQRNSLEAVMPYKMEDVQSRTEMWNSFWESRRDTLNAMVLYEAANNGIDGDMLTPYGAHIGTSLVQKAMANLNHDFNYVLWVCAFVVFTFLLLSMRSAEAAVISFMPMTISWFWILGIMAIAGIEFNIVNIVLATFIFGLGDDYAIFMMDGVMQENTYGSRMLEVDKTAVTLSAATLFAGVCTLITARHPALRSLASVTAIGMASVVLAAFIVPPYFYRLLTQRGGEQRDLPITFGRFFASLYALLYYVVMAFIISVVGLFIKKRTFHKLIQRVAHYTIRHIPGAPFTLDNSVCETFEKPAVIVCNHQSMFDIMAIMALSPNIIILTNDWVWNSLFFKKIVRKANFYPVSMGYENMLPHIKDMVSQGYSVMVFPEGTRTKNGDVGAFHPGAFRIARDLGLDILPLIIHGFWNVLPKTDMLIHRGSLFMRVYERVNTDQYAEANDASCRKLARKFRNHYMNMYATLRRERENADYFIPYLRCKYALKSLEVRQSAYRELQNRDALRELCRIEPAGGEAYITDGGVGIKGWIYALTHPDVEVYAHIESENEYKAAINTACIPKNLHFISYICTP